MHVRSWARGTESVGVHRGGARRAGEAQGVLPCISLLVRWVLTFAQREHESKPWVSYWKNNVTLAIVTDMVTMNMVQTPPQIRDLLHLDHTTMQYDPKFYVNDFWTYRDHYYVINSTVTSLPVDLVFQTQGLWAWQLTTQMQQSFETQASWGALGGGGTGGNEMDEMKVRRCLFRSALLTRV